MSHVYKSSFMFTTLTPFGKDDFRKAKHIISHIIENPESVEFRQPVRWQELNLLDYPELILYPMDLGTILHKLNEEHYENIEEFLDDFELIWDNCKSYNIKGTWIYGLADKLEKNGKKMLKNYFPTIPLQSVKNLQQSSIQTVNAPSPAKPPSKSKKQDRVQKPQKRQKADNLYYEDDEEITQAHKINLADKFKTFAPAQNKQLVEYIQSVCPTAFREHEGKVQIIVDNMDIITFKQIIAKTEEIEDRGQSGSEPIKRVKFE